MGVEVGWGTPGAGHPWPSELDNQVAVDLDKCTKAVTYQIIPRSLKSVRQLSEVLLSTPITYLTHCPLLKSKEFLLFIIDLCKPVNLLSACLHPVTHKSPTNVHQGWW